MPEPFRRSPLHHRHMIEVPGAARLAERAFLGKWVLRGEPATVGGPVKEAIGLPMPDTCRSVESQNAAILWIGPDEHWIVSHTPLEGEGRVAGPGSGEAADSESADRLSPPPAGLRPSTFPLQGEVKNLASRLAGTRHQLVDVSAYYTAIELAGPSAREMLMKLTTLDLHPRAFVAGQVAGSMFGHAQGYLWLRSDAADGPVFLLFVRRTMADYLWCLLAEAGREWGLPGHEPLAGEVWRLAR